MTTYPEIDAEEEYRAIGRDLSRLALKYNIPTDDIDPVATAVERLVAIIPADDGAERLLQDWDED